tara:strand:+ start:551 stop:808 length:258 start_codon:yes stop_codon:yes gene_type:complete
MNYDRIKQEELLYSESCGSCIPIEKDHKYQSELLKKQLQMILDDERGDNDLDKKIKILETQNKILQAEKKFLADTLKEHGILTMK